MIGASWFLPDAFPGKIIGNKEDFLPARTYMRKRSVCDLGQQTGSGADHLRSKQRKERSMHVRSLFVRGIASAAACAAVVTGLRYRRWKQRLRQRLQSESGLLETSRGMVEYQMEGAGPVVLVLHGSPGGYDYGMAVAHVLAQSDFTF